MVVHVCRLSAPLTSYISLIISHQVSVFIIWTFDLFQPDQICFSVHLYEEHVEKLFSQTKLLTKAIIN